MKGPSKIVVDGDDVVSVEYDARLGRLAEGYSKGGDYHKGKIRIARCISKRGRRNTVFHELWHHLWRRAGLSLTLSERTEELVLDELSVWVLDALRDNRDLRDFLFEGAE